MNISFLNMRMEIKMENNLQNDNREYIKLVIAIVAFVGTMLFGFFMMGDCMEVILRYFLALLVLGLAVFPLSAKLFKAFHNGGYLYSKVIGLLLSGYFMWLLSSLRILKFTTSNSLICVIVTALVIYFFFCFLYRKKDKTEITNFLTEKWFAIFMSEVFFLLMFLFFIFLLGHKIPGVETEKSMDYAFMSTMMRTDYMPPLDMWAAGKTLNYYYFGQYIMTFLSRISFCGVKYGYTLSVALIGAFCFTLVANLVYEVMSNYLKQKGKKRNIAFLTAALSAIAVTFSGNMHYFIFSKVTPALWDMLKIPGEKPGYWFADSTRYIGYTPEVINDKTIAEFPFYSFLIGDLHAHVIDILVVLTILALLYAYFHRETDEKREIFNKQLIMIGFLIGISCMTNYWDYPIYFVVSGSVVLAFNFIQYKLNIKTFLTTAVQGIVILTIAKLISLPFSMKFDQMIMGIKLCTTHSQFYQLCILWGLPVILVTGFLVVVIKNWKKSFCKEDLFVLLLGLCAVGLVVMPELIYVRDIYEEGFPRANTMFKLTYEAFILFGISMGYIIIRFIYTSATPFQRKAGITGLICLLLTTGYFFTASKMWLGSYMNRQEFKGIDASISFDEIVNEDMDAIEWLCQNIEGQPVVLEADGDSYTGYERVSTLTGFPTVLGWHTHEWLWRNGYSIIEERQTDVTEIYDGNSADTKKALLDKYEVEYIFVGSKEYEKYPDMDISLLEGMGDVVYSNIDENTLKLIEIIKVE